VGDGEAVDFEIGDREALAHFDEFGGRGELLPIESRVGAGVQVDGQRGTSLRLLVLEKADQAADMVTVFVADNDGGDFLGVNGTLREALIEFAAADAGIEEDTGAAGGDERGIARTAAGQDGDADDGWCSVSTAGCRKSSVVGWDGSYAAEGRPVSRRCRRRIGVRMGLCTECAAG
jgi:hypothetical protein